MNNNPAPSTVPGESKNCKRCGVMLGPHSTNVQMACPPPFTPLGLGTPGTSQAPYKAKIFVHCPTAMLAELDSAVVSRGSWTPPAGNTLWWGRMQGFPSDIMNCNLCSRVPSTCLEY